MCENELKIMITYNIKIDKKNNEIKHLRIIKIETSKAYPKSQDFNISITH